MDERTSEQPGRVLTCPVEQHPGTVTLKALTFPLFWEWNQALEQLPDDKENAKQLPDDEEKAKRRLGSRVYSQYQAMLEPVCDCVAEWNLEGFERNVSYATFPADHINSRLAVLGWLVAEINKLFFGGGKQSPNG